MDFQLKPLMLIKLNQLQLEFRHLEIHIFLMFHEFQVQLILVTLDHQLDLLCLRKQQCLELLLVLLIEYVHLFVALDHQHLKQLKLHHPFVLRQ